MKKTIVLLLVLLLMLVSAVSAKSGSSSLPTSIIPGNAQWVIHLDMKQFHATRFSELVKGNNINWFTIINQMMKTGYKIDLINNTTGITVFGMDKDKRNNVVCLSGNFDKGFILSRLEEAAGYQKVNYGKYVIHKWKGSQFGVFVNDHLLMYSLRPMDESALKDVLDAISGKKKNITTSHMMAYIKEMPNDAFLKAAADNISALSNNPNASMILKKTGMAFFIAMERNENLKLKLKLNTDTPETAKNIEQIVKGYIALARMKQGEKNSWWKIVESLKTKLVGNVLQFELSYPSKHLIEMFSHRKH
jgi:hypothetical protein